ncbi:MAG: GtrA family protein [Saprospiraceae bacterium]
MKVKYTIVSLLATAADFSVFSAVTWATEFYTVAATSIGMAGGALVSWTLHRSWVFAHSERDETTKRGLYFSGVLLSVFLNVALMGILVDLLFLPRMGCRVVVATAVWAILFWFNRRIVFNVA